MKKLIISGRTNQKKKIYIKFKATKKSMTVINKIMNEIDENLGFMLLGYSISLSNYKKWKDEWIPIRTKNIEIDLICGDKCIHMIFNKFPNFEYVNKILDKYCDWVQPKYKKGFSIPK